MIIAFELNGRPTTWNIEPTETLLQALRRNGLFGAKQGCDTASCGVCTVLLDGKPVPSCAVPAARVAGHSVLTVEGVPDKARAIGEAMTSEGADQCGYCAPGLVMSLVAMQQELDQPDEEEIASYLAGNLCRCSGYASQSRAIKKFMEESR